MGNLYATPCTCFVPTFKCVLQEVRSGIRACRVYHEVIRELAEKMKADKPRSDTIAAHLLAIKVMSAARACLHNRSCLQDAAS